MLCRFIKKNIVNPLLFSEILFYSHKIYIVLCCKNVKLTSESEYNKTYDVTCAPSKGSGQHNCTVIRGFHIRLMQFIIAA